MRDLVTHSTMPLFTTHRRLAIVLGAGGFAWCALAQAAYPARPVRVIVGFPAGSGTDMIARFVGNKLTYVSGNKW